MRITEDAGFVSVFVTSIVGVMTVMALTLVGLGALLSARAQVQRAADLIALAAAPISNVEPCELADDVARRNNVELIECKWSDGDIEITVHRPTGLVLVPTLTAHASAKATIPTTLP